MNGPLKPDDGIDFDFRYHLRSTLILLGGKKEIADLMIKSMDLGVDEADLLMLQNYNIELYAAAKDRLANFPTIKIRTSGEQ